MTGISWVRASERIREQMANFAEPWATVMGPTVSLPLYRLGDLVPPQHANCRSTLTGKTADQIIVDDPPASIGGFRFPDGSLDDCKDEPPPSAA